MGLKDVYSLQGLRILYLFFQTHLLVLTWCHFKTY